MRNISLFSENQYQTMMRKQKSENQKKREVRTSKSENHAFAGVRTTQSENHEKTGARTTKSENQGPTKNSAEEFEFVEFMNFEGKRVVMKYEKKSK